MIDYSVEVYTGRALGRYGARKGVQIVATDLDTSKRKYVFQHGNNKSPCFKMGTEVYSHYKTGTSERDSTRLARDYDAALKIAARLQDEQPY